MSGFLDSIGSICRMAGARSSTKDSADRGHSCFPKRSKRTVRYANVNLDAVNQKPALPKRKKFWTNGRKAEVIQNGVLRSLRRAPSTWKIDALPEK
jgi:hypothetical protein